MKSVKKTETYLIRQASEEDLVPVMNINRICLPENYSYFFFQTILRDYPKTFLVAEVNGKIVGYVMCRVERILSKLDRFRFKRAGHVISIAVLPEYRNRGIARSLLNRAINVLKDEYKCEEVFLEVRVSNNPAISLYEKLGFLKVNISRRYYLDGEDAYIMARKL
ncbi:MAG: ribosomal-protein-alanine N-acetyltransferase [Thaumarchaeota archaeon]|nr:MAG: ribosomal-protein-alanine N-acetyltransferase [Nitrososphaerota archaeon]